MGVYINPGGNGIVGWIGTDDGPGDGGYTATGCTGAWFKKIYIGGTGPDSSKVRADDNGNVSIDGSLIVGTVPSATVAVSAGTAISANVANAANTASSANSVPAGGIQAGTITASVKMSSPDIDSTDGSNQRVRLYQGWLYQESGNYRASMSSGGMQFTGPTATGGLSLGSAGISAMSNTSGELLFACSDVRGGIYAKQVTLKASTSFPPANPTEGMICYDASTHHLKYYNGSGWVTL